MNYLAELQLKCQSNDIPVPITREYQLFVRKLGTVEIGTDPV